MIDNSSSDDYLSLVKLLGSRHTYADQTQSVKPIETHISSVFITDQFVYKLKKPIKFDFLDYSTVERRMWACQEEIRINSRLAPDVYLGIVPIVRTADGELRLDGQGDPVDWVVKMRRLPSDATLACLIRSGKIRDDHITAIIRLLSLFYRSAPRLALDSHDYRNEILRHVLGNRCELLDEAYGLSQALVKRVHAAQLQFLRMHPKIFDNRVCKQRIVDGHGDLRPEHIYFLANPIVIDGIEFNAELRHVDVLDELCFLAMECTALGAASVGQQIIDGCCEAANDHPPRELASFYQSYRACVRGKIAAIRASQVVGQARDQLALLARNYLTLADRFCSDCCQPMFILVWGMSGTGKSSVATELAAQLGCDLIQTDWLRRELFGNDLQPSAYSSNRYTEENRDLVYKELFRRSASKLKEGISVVLDGTFLSAKHRQRAWEQSQAFDAQWSSIYCHCPDDVALARIRHRQEVGNSISDFRSELFADQRRSLEASEDCIPPFSIDTNQALPQAISQIMDGIGEGRKVIPPVSVTIGKHNS